MALCKQKKKCFIWASMYLECVNAFYVSYWRRDHHFTRSSKPRKGPATVALLLVKLTSLPPPQNNEGWRMVKSKTLRDTEILFRNPSPRLFVESFETQKSKNKPCKNETSRLIRNASEISGSCQNFPRPTFFEVPFATPTMLIILSQKGSFLVHYPC